MENREPNGLELSLSPEVFAKDLSLSQEISNRNGKKVAIFGGGGISADSFYYEKAMELGQLLSSAGISIITGGGPGIMEAGNRGAKNGQKSSSYALRVLPIKEENCSVSYFDLDSFFEFDTLAVRLLALISNSDAIVFFPGGYGTLDELFSLLVRLRVGFMNAMPVYLFGSEYWDGLVSWMANVILPHRAINERDLELFSVEDDIGKISKDIISHCLPLN